MDKSGTNQLILCKFETYRHTFVSLVFETDPGIQ